MPPSKKLFNDVIDVRSRITRGNVLRVCREAGIPSYERNFSLTDVYGAEEAFVRETARPQSWQTKSPACAGLFSERTTGVEPATSGLGSPRSAN